MLRNRRKTFITWFKKILLKNSKVDGLDIDAFEDNTCVIQSDFDLNDLGKILWFSKNSKKLLKIEDHNVANQNINNFIPNIASIQHDKILINYYNRGYSSFINSPHDLWMYDNENMLFSNKIYTKVFFDKDRLSFMTFVKKINDLNFLLLTERGEIDSFGKNFKHLSRLNYKFVSIQNNIPIFLFIPQLIPFFLPYFYELPDFELKVV